MIVSAIDSRMQSLIDYLNKHYPTSEDVTLVVLPGYDSVAFGSTRAWAAYEPAAKVLWVPGDVPELPDLSMDEARQVVYEHVVHEYIHHIQACEGRPFDEVEAEARAQDIVAAWIRDERLHVCMECIDELTGVDDHRDLREEIRREQKAQSESIEEDVRGAEGDSA